MSKPKVLVIDSLSSMDLSGATLLTGRPGEGKSTIAIEWMERARHEGVPILFIAHTQRPER